MVVKIWEIVMRKEQRITIYKSNNILKKIKSFFKKIFNRFKYQENKKEIVYETNNFKDEIAIKQDKEKLRNTLLKDSLILLKNILIALMFNLSFQYFL